MRGRCSGWKVSWVVSSLLTARREEQVLGGSEGSASRSVIRPWASPITAMSTMTVVPDDCRGRQRDKSQRLSEFHSWAPCDASEWQQGVKSSCFLFFIFGAQSCFFMLETQILILFFCFFLCVCVYVCVPVYTLSNIRLSPELTSLCRGTGKTEHGGSRLMQRRSRLT